MDIDTKEIRHLWMPIQKSPNGDFRAILSDTSIDRDNELMSKDLMETWAKNGSLPTLINHENKMESWIGGWSDFQVHSSKDGHYAISAVPKFFSEAANPKAAQIHKQIDEALGMGLNAGVSIGARPLNFKEVEKGRRMWTEAELLEASFVPVVSNRNAAYGYRDYEAIAKDFDIEIKEKETPEEKKKRMEEEKKKKEESKEPPKKEKKEVEPEIVKEDDDDELVDGLDYEKDELEVEDKCNDKKKKPKEEKMEEIKTNVPVIETKEVSEIETLKKQIEELKMLMPKKAVIEHMSEQMPMNKSNDYSTVRPTVANMIAAKKGFNIPQEYR